MFCNSRKVFEKLCGASKELHEGQLSYQYGFVPHTPFPERLPHEYHIWEHIAQQMPTILAAGEEQAILRTMPILSTQGLTSHYLARSATILANFTYAYLLNIQHQPHEEKIDLLPAAITKPYAEVCEQLGRPYMMPSIFDAFMCNWKLKNPKAKAPLSIDDLALLIPLFANNEETLFNLTPLIMELKFASAIEPCFSALEAVMANKDEQLTNALMCIEAVLQTVSAQLDNISPIPGSKHYVDPVSWAKTVARFGEPLERGKTGAGGASFPLFHFMDILIERESYQSKMGNELTEKAALLPIIIEFSYKACRLT